MSMDVVVYYLILKSSLMAFKWSHCYVIEVTIGQDISKIKKNTLLPHYGCLFESLSVMHIIRKAFENASRWYQFHVIWPSIDRVISKTKGCLFWSSHYVMCPRLLDTCTSRNPLLPLLGMTHDDGFRDIQASDMELHDQACDMVTM